MKKCPNYSSIEFKKDVESIGEEKAVLKWLNELEENKTFFSINAINKVKSLNVKKGTFNREIVNKEVVVDGSNENRRLYNVEIQDEQGNYTNSFVDVVTQKDGVDTLFSFFYEQSIRLNNEKSNNKEIDFNYIYNLATDSLKSLIDNVESTVSKAKDMSFLQRLQSLSIEEKKYLLLNKNIKELKDIYNSRSQFKKFVENKFNSLKINIDNIEDLLLDDDYGGGSDLRAESLSNEEKDSKETMSSRVKMFLSTVKSYKYNKEDDSFYPLSNSLGLSKFEDFNILYDKIVLNTSNIPDFNEDKLISLLLENKENASFYNLGLKISKSEGNIINELVSSFKRAFVEPSILFINGENSYLSKGNLNRIPNKIINNWKENQKLKSNYDFDLVFSLEDINYLKDSFLKIYNNEFIDISQYKEVSDKMFNMLGIKLSDSAYSELLEKSIFKGSNGKIINNKFNKEFKNQFLFASRKNKESYPNGIFSFLYFVIINNSKFSDGSVVANNPLYTDLEGVNFLALLEAKYTNETESNYLSIEGKNIYSVVLPSHETTILNKVKYDKDFRLRLESDLFASNSYLFRLLNNPSNNYEFRYFEGISNNTSGKKIIRSKQSFRENLVMQASLFKNEDKDTANYLGLTKSDKKTSYVHTNIPKISKEGMYSEYFNIFKSEFIRIINKDKLKATGQLNKGSGLFYLLKEFNYELLKEISDNLDNGITQEDIKMLYLDKDTINSKLILDESSYDDFYNLFKRIIDYKVKNLTQEYIANIIKTNEPIKIKTDEDKAFIESLVFNTNIFNMSLAMLVSGDPASFYKGKKAKNISSIIKQTYDEYTKRLAKDLANGISPNFKNSTYKSLTIAVPNFYTYEYTDLFLNRYYGKEEGKDSGSIDVADASQFCSVKRFFEILYSLGRVDLKTYNKALNLEEDEFLDNDLLSYIAPLKPVEVSVNSSTTVNYEDTEYNYSYIDYVKSSLIPLVPNNTYGFEIDKLRKLLNNYNIEQVNLDTAGKGGNPTNILVPFDSNNNFVFNEETDLEVLQGSTKIMQSNGFYIQQEIPFDETKEKITFITQLNKLIGDSLPFIKQSVFDLNGKKLTGYEIISEKERIRKKMIELSFNDLKFELGLNEDDSIDIEKFKNFIVKNSDVLNESDLINLDILNNRFKTPMLFNNIRNSLESKIASKVRKAIQVKISGKSFVQVTSLGIKKLDNSDDFKGKDIIPVKGWDGKRLKPLRPVIKEIYELTGKEIYLNDEQLNSEFLILTQKQIDSIYDIISDVRYNINYSKLTSQILPAEILLPFNFFDEKSNRLKIEDFTKDGFVDLDDDLLKLIGARIPNQSHSSQLPMKIVGFLPVNSDIIYVPAEITKQMGSDFDVDKLYVYKKKYKALKSYNVDIKLLKEEKSLLIQDNLSIKLTQEENDLLQKNIEKYYSKINSNEYLKRVVQDVFFNYEDYTEFDFLSIGLEELKKIRNGNYKSLTKEEFNIIKEIKKLDNEYKDLIYIQFISEELKDRKQLYNSNIQRIKEINKLLNENSKSSYNQLTTDLSLDINGQNKDDFDSESSSDYQNNQYVDVLYNILINKSMFNKIMKPLDSDDLKDVVALKEKNNLSTYDLFSPIKQIDLYISNIGVKRLVGTFSLGLTFNTLLQRTKNINVKNSFKIAGLELNTISGLGFSNFKTTTANEIRSTSDNIIIVQSESVDNAKNQIVDKINLGDETSFAYLALLSLKSNNSNSNINALGNEYASQLINNDLIRAFSQLYKQNLDMFGNTLGNPKAKAVKSMGFDYDTLINNSYEIKDSDLGIIRNDKGEITELKNITNSKDNFKVLSLFLKLDLLGSEIFTLMNLSNVDTKGLGSNLIDGFLKSAKVNNLQSNFQLLSNVDELLYLDETKEELSELGYSNQMTDSILNPMYDFFNYKIIDKIVNRIQLDSNKELNAKDIRKITASFDSYVKSNNLYWENTKNEKFRLLFTFKNNDSLAKRLLKLKSDFPEYRFFNLLKTKLKSKEKEADYIYYDAVDYDKHKEFISQEFFILLNSENIEISEFMKDLIRYNYLFSNNPATSISKLIPNFTDEEISSLFYDTIESRMLSNENIDSDINFVRQYYQHNPELTVSVSKGQINNKLMYVVSDYFDNQDTIPRFIRRKGYNNEGKPKLYLYELIDRVDENIKGSKYNNKGKYQYLLIDTLGNNFISEYEYDNPSVNSVIIENKTSGLHVNQILDSVTTDLKNTDRFILEDSFINEKSLVSTLNNLSNYDLDNVKVKNEYNKYAKLIELTEFIALSSSLDTKLKSSNYNFYNGNINLDFNSDNIIKNMLHESYHFILSDYIEKNKKKDVKIEKIEKLRRDLIKKLDSRGSSIVKEISILKNDKNKLKNVEEIFNKNSDLDINDLIYYYSLSDINEYISALFTDLDFQRRLNEQKYEGEKSFLTKLINYITDLIVEIGNNLGIIVDNDSYLNESLYSVLSLIETFKPTNNKKVGILYSVSDKNNIKTKPLSDILGQLINDISSETELDKYSFNKNIRLKNIIKDYNLLKEDKKNENSKENILGLGEKHLNYISKLIDTFNPEINSIDEISNAYKIFETWKSIVNLFPDYNEDEDFIMLQSKFTNLEESFKDLRLSSFISNTQIGTDFSKKDITTDLEDRNLASQVTLASTRTSNLAIQAINLSLSNAKSNSLRNHNLILDKLNQLSEIIKNKNLDISNFIVDSDGEGIRLITPYDYSKREVFVNNYSKLDKNKIDIYNKENISFDIKKLFRINDDFSVTYLEENLESEIDRMYKIIGGNKELVDYSLRNLFNKQKLLIDKYAVNLKINNEILSESEIKEWNEKHNPFTYTSTKKKVKTFLLDIPSNPSYWNKDFEKIYSNEDLLSVYNEVSLILSDLLSLLPRKYKKDGSFLPSISNSLIKEKLTFMEGLKDMMDLKLTAPDDFTIHNEIPLLFLDAEDEAKLNKSKNYTKDLLNILRLFSETVNHHYYFSQAKSYITTGRSLLDEATPVVKDFKGNSIIKKGKELLSKKGNGLERELELLDDTIKHIMFLERTKPEVALINNFKIELTDFDDLKDVNEKEKKEGKSIFTIQELDRELEIINNSIKTFRKNKNVFDKISLLKDKFKAKYNNESYETVETLYNFYMEKLDELKEKYKNKELSYNDFEIQTSILNKRLKILNRSTIYGSKIVDAAIRQRRGISLGLNPFSAFRNYVGGVLNGVVNGGIEYDNLNFISNVFKVSSLMIKSTDESYKLYKISRKLLVLDNIIDFQGMTERSYFDKYGYLLMEKSEQAVRIALMKSILEKENLFELFDNEGNIDLSNDEINRLILKIRRTNDIVMGDTHSYKMINKSFFGRAVGQFKSSWLPENLASRFESEKYDSELQRNIKGRYITYKDLGIVGSLIGTVKVYQNWLSRGENQSYKELKNTNNETISDIDSVNLVRNTLEISMVLSLLFLGLVLRNLADDLDDEEKDFVVFLTNQITLIERDLTTGSPTNLVELLGGNAVPSISVFTNLYSLIPASIKLATDDKFTYEDYIYKLGKVIPLVNIMSQFKYQSEHFVDDLN